MNKKTIFKIILSIITVALIISLTTSVFAEDDEGAVDLSGSITNKEDKTENKTLQTKTQQRIKKTPQTKIQQEIKKVLQTKIQQEIKKILQTKKQQ